MKTEEQKKEIKRISSKKYREANKIKIKLINKHYRETTNYDKNYYELNKELVKEKRKKYYLNNKEKIAFKDKKYFENNKQLIYNRNKNREISSPIFKLKKNIRTLIRNSFLYIKAKKESKTQLILGCSYEDFKSYLESKFDPWMTWDNRGLYNGTTEYGWDIDHIIPISLTKTTEDVIKLNHYTNLQPLCSYINRDIKKDNV